MSPKVTTIPIRAIVAVDVAGMTQVVAIKTMDGKQYKYGVGGWNHAQQVRDAILQAMK